MDNLRGWDQIERDSDEIADCPPVENRVDNSTGQGQSASHRSGGSGACLCVRLADTLASSATSGPARSHNAPSAHWRIVTVQSSARTSSTVTGQIVAQTDYVYRTPCPVVVHASVQTSAIW